MDQGKKNKINVLYIEDDYEDFLLVEDYLNDVQNGIYKIDRAVSFDEGYQHLASGKYDICLVDHRLGDKSGLNLIRKALRKRIDTPIILLTGLNQRDIDEEALKSGAYDFISKNDMNSILLERSIRYAIRQAKTVKKLLLSQKKSRENANRFRNLVESSNDWIWETDKNGQYVYSSPQIEKILGYKAKEILGKTPFDLIHLKDKRLLVEKYHNIFQKGLPFNDEIKHNVHKNGTAVPLESSGSPILDKQNNVIGYRGIDRDVTEKYKTLKEIHRLALASETTDDMIFITDSQRHIEWANESFYHKTKFTKNDIYGKALEEILHLSQVDNQIVEEILKNIEEEKDYNRNIAFVSKLNEPYWFDFTIKPLFDDDGIKSFFILANDISLLMMNERTLLHLNETLEERVNQRTKELSEKEKILRLALSGSNAGLIYIDAKNNKVDLDPQSMEILEMKGSEFTRKFNDVWKLMYRSRQKTFHNDLREIFKNSDFTHLNKNYQVITKERGVRYIEASGFIERNERGIPVTFYGILFDYTTKKLNEIQNSQNRIALEAILNSTSDGFAATDLTGKLLFINRNFTNFYNIPDQIIENKNVKDMIQYMENQIQKSTTEVYTEDYPDSFTWVKQDLYLLKDGRYLESRIYPLILGGRSLSGSGLVYSLRDITNQIKSKEELRKSKEIAEKASNAKSDFLAVVSHEIRTPMNAIIGMSHLLGNTSLNNKQRFYLNRISFSSQHLLDIINEILDFSKIEADKIELKMEPFNFNDLMNNVREILIARAREKKLDLIIDYDESSLPFNAIGDSLRLRQILINLCANAIKFTNEGYIKIKVEKSLELENKIELKFTIKDTGIGIREKDQKIIFEAFSQIDSSSTRDFTGTGLGLTISQKLIELMNGKIWVESKLMTGSSFYFTVQLETASHLKKKLKESKSLLKTPIYIPENAIVMIVEDNEINREVITELLNAFGLNHESFTNGKDAYEKIIENPFKFDIILMDMQMPIMDGIEATKKIREHGATIPIIALSGDVVDKVKARAFSAGVNEFIAKPFDPDSLVQTILKYIPKDKKHISFSSESHKVKNNDFFSSISGLNATEGLSRVAGNHTKYLKILKQFCEKSKIKYNKCISLFNNAQTDLLKEEIHSLKGLSGNVGAKTIYKSTIAFENALQKKRDNDSENILITLGKEINHLCNQIEMLSFDQIKKEETNSSFSNEVKKSLPIEMEELYNAVLSIDKTAINKAKTILEENPSLKIQKCCQEVIKALQTYDFETAKDLLRKHLSVEKH